MECFETPSFFLLRLKINGWKMKFPFEMVPLLGHIDFRGGGGVINIPTLNPPSNGTDEDSAGCTF